MSDKVAVASVDMRASSVAAGLSSLRGELLSVSFSSRAKRWCFRSRDPLSPHRRTRFWWCGGVVAPVAAGAPEPPAAAEAGTVHVA
eukprot:5170052-Pleurochrysis_carterae.AAC.1